MLRQVAAILGRLLRGSDFLARYGGDEFVIVLPDTPLAAASDVTGRLAAAVNSFDWAILVPGTPVTVTMGLAELSPGTDMVAAFQAAEQARSRRKAGR